MHLDACEWIGFDAGRVSKRNRNRLRRQGRPQRSGHPARHGARYPDDSWPEAFCDGLAARGFRVIRFDNRDVGLSSKFESAPPIDLAAIMQAATAGRKISTPYDLTDMAKDAVGLMDRLSIGKAHVVGASMGGMVAQIVAGQYPERVRSLVSVMSSSGDP